MDKAELAELVTQVARQAVDAAEERFAEKFGRPIMGRLDQLEIGVGRMDTRLDRMDTRLEQMDTRLEQMDTRLDRMDTRLDRMDTRLDQMDTRLDRMDTRLDRMDTRLDQIDTRLDQMDSHLGQVEKDIQKVQGDMSSEFFSLKRRMDEGFKSLEKEIGRNWESEKQDVSAVFGDIAKLKKTTTNHGKRLTALEKARGTR